MHASPSVPVFGSFFARGGSILDLHDVVLWCGDLNYRVNGTAGAVKAVLEKDMPEVGARRYVYENQRMHGDKFNGLCAKSLCVTV